MSEITIKCLRCGKKHGLEIYNARIYGPVIHVYCPFCKRKTIKNLTRFIEMQISKRGSMGRYELCGAMSNLIRKTIKELTA